MQSCHLRQLHDDEKQSAEPIIGPSAQGRAPGHRAQTHGPDEDAGRVPTSASYSGEAAASVIPSYLSTLDEDSNIGMTSDDSVVIEGLDKSPCPPPMAKKLGLLGVPMLGARRNGASRPLQRAQTFAQVR